MITIGVETDEEETAVLAALKSGALSDALGRSFVIRRGHRSIGGVGTNSVIQFSGGADSKLPTSGGAGGTGGNGGLTAPEIWGSLR